MMFLLLCKSWEVRSKFSMYKYGIILCIRGINLSSLIIKKKKAYRVVRFKLIMRP